MPRPFAPSAPATTPAAAERLGDYHTAVAAAQSSFQALPWQRVRAAALRIGARKATAPGARPAPISLTASDGTGLQLVSLEARAVLEGPLAFTELHLTFRNPQPRVLEGHFDITLPDEAAISRFAMLLDDGWQEAEVVERKAAQQMYEEFLHRRQDPALLEKKAGNEFSARIFPIPARGEKQIKISYSQELRAAGAPYRLPLKGLPQLARLKVSALVGAPVTKQAATSLGGTLVSRQVVEVRRERYRPDRDFELQPQGAPEGLRHGNLVVARIRPQLPAAEARLDDLLVLVDTSASRAAGFAAQVELLGGLVKALAQPSPLRLRVACFDQSLESVHDGTATDFGEPHLQRILARQALGASDLAGALAWARGKAARVLLLTDGVVTTGRTDGSDLRKAVAALGPSTRRLDVVLVGGIREEGLMGRLARGNLREDGAVLDGELASVELARRLRQRTISGLEVEVKGARWVWPTVIDGAQPGDEHLVYADLPTAGDALSIRLSRPAEQTLRVQLASAERPLLERSWVKADLARRTAGLELLRLSAREQAQREIVALSTKHRVLSDFTALLVLETDWDYQRFGLERRALANILAVGPSGIEVVQRAGPVLGGARRWASDEAAAGDSAVLGLLRSGRGSQIASIFGRDAALGTDAQDALGHLIGNQIGDSYGVGGLGIVGTGRGGGGLIGARGPASNGVLGTGRGGGGTGEGNLGLDTLGTIGRGSGGSGVGYGRGVGRLSGRRASAPVVAGRAEVRGSLDKEPIRRVIRRHLNEVRYCYQRELQTKPGLAGRVVLQFTIGAEGQVVASAVQQSSLGNAAAEQCIASAVRRWTFPRPPGGGIVIVTYPFDLRAPGGPEPAPLPRTEPAALPPVPAAAAPAVTDDPASRFTRVQELLRRQQVEAALLAALEWRAKDPGDTLALVALGEALQARGWSELAARAYGSLIDLYPSRADLRRFAGERLEALAASGRSLAVDTYSVALAQRPDQLSGYRLLAFALLRRGNLARAFATLEKGLARPVPEGRFLGVQRVLREDLGLVAAAWLRAEPGRRQEVLARLERAGSALSHAPSLRFVLSWETDANDVDLHVRDGKGSHAYYGDRRLPSGGELYEDVTTGYGPECFTISGKAAAFPYRLSVHYFAQGPMGYGMGKVEVIEHDGAGRLRFEQRPFVVLENRSEVELGTVAAR